MKHFEKILVVGIVLALILKFNQYEGSDLLLLWSLTILAGIYYPLGFLLFNQIRLRNIFKKSSYRDVSSGQIVVAVVAGLGLANVCIGVLFKLLVFPGSHNLIIAGLVIMMISMVVAVIRIRKYDDRNAPMISRRLVIAGVLGLVALLIPHLTIVKFQYRNYPRYIEAYERADANPKDKTLQKEKQKEYYRMVMSPEQFEKYEAGSK